MGFFFPINIHRSPVTKARERSFNIDHLKKVAGIREGLVGKATILILAGSDFNLETGGSYLGSHKN